MYQFRGVAQYPKSDQQQILFVFWNKALSNFENYIYEKQRLFSNHRWQFLIHNFPLLKDTWFECNCFCFLHANGIISCLERGFQQADIAITYHTMKSKENFCQN